MARGLWYNSFILYEGEKVMKKLLAILLALCLLTVGAALAEAAKTEPEATESADAAQDADLLPSPEEVTDAAADAQEPSPSYVVWFEEGFGLSLPEGWVRYEISDADAEAGVRYALGDGSGENFLYIQLTPTELSSFGALSRAVDARPDYAKTGSLTFGGVEFVTFIDGDRNASCCATLWDRNLLAFIFTPQSDLDYMLVVSKVMETFCFA